MSELHTERLVTLTRFREVSCLPEESQGAAIFSADSSEAPFGFKCANDDL